MLVVFIVKSRITSYWKDIGSVVDGDKGFESAGRICIQTLLFFWAWDDAEIEKVRNCSNFLIETFTFDMRHSTDEIEARYRHVEDYVPDNIKSQRDRQDWLYTYMAAAQIQHDEEMITQYATIPDLTAPYWPIGSAMTYVKLAVLPCG